MRPASHSPRPVRGLAFRLILGSILALSSLSAGTSCAPVTTIAPKLQNPATLASASHLMAGVAKVDITPPPGLPKAGYSSNGRNAKGFRTRLYARVFYLKPKEGEPLVVVQTDLLAGSSILQRLVASRVGAQTDIRPHNLAIMATHTHAGPGNYLGSNFYNRFAANQGGFDPDWTNFLADRISSAVIDAWNHRAPATIAVGRTDLFGMTRNRSLIPHLRNTTVTNKRPDAHQKYAAINPALHMVRIDAVDTDGKPKPLGAFSTFSIHGTGIPNTEEAYNADVWAWIEQEVEWGIRQEYKPSWEPVHGPFEGTHGDMAPDLHPGMAGYLESRRIGTAIGQKALELLKSLDGKGKEEVVLKSAFREIDLFQQPEAGEAAVCKRPYVGGALLGGAFENVTPGLVKVPPFAPGIPRFLFQAGCQAQKRVILSRLLQPVVLPTADFPHVLPMQLLRIDDMLLMALPFEITTESGRRIENAVRDGWQQGGGSITHVAVSSVANEYFGYATTPEEYSRQNYEGGHTLYGPGTVPYLMTQTRQLALDMAISGNISGLMEERRFDLRTVRYMPTATTVKSTRKALEDPQYRDAKANAEGYWQFFWKDVPPDRILWHEPLVRVEVSDDGEKWKLLEKQGRPVNDEGYDVGVYYRGDTSDGYGRYEARWFNPLFDGGKRFLRFVIAPREDQPELASPVFR